MSVLADSNALPEVNTRDLPEVWDCSDDDGEVEPHQNPKNGSKAEMTTASLILLKFMVIFLLTWQAIFQVSNTAMYVVFKLSSVLHKLGDFAESAKLKLLAEAFANTMLKAHMLHAINRDNYQQLVVCEKCNSTYEYSDCLKNVTESRNNITCSFIRLPRHPQAHMRSCGTLLKTKDITQNCS